MKRHEEGRSLTKPLHRTPHVDGWFEVKRFARWVCCRPYGPKMTIESEAMHPSALRTMIM